MIELTRLNGHLMVVNSDLIKYAESSPDTMLTLINGEKIVVLEPCAEVIRRITAYRALLLADVLKLTPGEGISRLAAAASGASGLRAADTEQGSPGSEIFDDSGETAPQRHRHNGL